MTDLTALAQQQRAWLDSYVQAGGSWDSAELRAVIDDLEHFGVKLGLERMERLIEELGERAALCPSVIVGGTNGKGSTTAMISELLQAHGLRTGHFTSPHLSNFAERIRIDGQPISEASILDAFGQAMSLRDRPGLEQLTFFEAVTGLGRLSFRDCDAAVYEVGLGGRLDATRLCGDRVLVVTSIDLDHTKTLGDTRQQIASEKFQALPDGGVLVFNGTDPELQVLALKLAAERGGRALLRGRDFDGQGSTEHFSFWTGSALGHRDLYGLRLSMRGEHQVQNAIGALAGFFAFAAGSDPSDPSDPSVLSGSRLRESPIPIDEAAIRRGLHQATIAGRLELFDGPVPFLIDGAHNVAGARALADWLRATVNQPGGPSGPVAAVIGLSRGKDIAGIGSELAPWLQHVVLTTAIHRRSLSTSDIEAAWGARVQQSIDDPFEALAAAHAWAAEHGGCVVVAGSLFLAGALRPLIERFTASASP